MNLFRRVLVNTPQQPTQNPQGEPLTPAAQQQPDFFREEQERRSRARVAIEDMARLHDAWRKNSIVGNSVITGQQAPLVVQLNEQQIEDIVHEFKRLQYFEQRVLNATSEQSAMWRLANQAARSPHV